MNDAPKRRWYHFSIRDLLLVTVIVAVCVAWWVDRSNSRRELERVKINLALEKDSNKNLRFITDIQEERIQEDREAKEELRRAIETARDMSHRLDAPEGNLLGPPLPLPESPNEAEEVRAMQERKDLEALSASINGLRFHRVPIPSAPAPNPPKK